MQFESGIGRRVWLTAVLGLVPDTLIAIVAAAVTDSGIVGFFVTLLGLQILYLLIWAKNSIWSWVVFSLGGGKRLSGFLLDSLRANRTRSRISIRPRSRITFVESRTTISNPFSYG
jgi:hypothetical protein